MAVGWGGNPATENIPFKETEVPPAFERTGLFLPGMTYKMTWIKTKRQLFLRVEGDDNIKKCTWDLRAFSLVKEGRIGLRYMFTRAAQYSKFNVFTK